MDAKQWKTTAIIFIIIAALAALFIGAMVWLKNRKPKWSLDSITGGVAKVKFGKKTYDYVLNTTDKPFVIGTGRYTLMVVTDTDSTGITGASAQLFDTKTGMPDGALMSLSVTA